MMNLGERMDHSLSRENVSQEATRAVTSREKPNGFRAGRMIAKARRPLQVGRPLLAWIIHRPVVARRVSKGGATVVLPSCVCLAARTVIVKVDKYSGSFPTAPFKWTASDATKHVRSTLVLNACSSRSAKKL